MPMQVSVEDIFQRTTLFIHGSTVVDNTVLERKGARTGLITTAGFRGYIAGHPGRVRALVGPVGGRT